MPVYGKVVAVTEEPVGTTLHLQASPGNLTLSLEDVSQLLWPEGSLQIDGAETHHYSVDNLPDQNTDQLEAIESATDIAQGTVTLASAVGDTYPPDTVVTQYPDVIEKLVTVMIPGQQEELVLRVPQHLTDRLPTGIRTDPDGIGIDSDGETVELEQRDDDWLIVDLVTQAGVGQSRGYISTATPRTVTATSSATPTVLLTLPIEIPTVQHRILVWYSWIVSTSSLAGGESVFLGLDDSGDDFNAPFGLDSVITDGERTHAPLSPIMPYGYDTTVTDAPSPGLHTLRLVAWKTTSGGVATVNEAQLWITVI